MSKLIKLIYLYHTINLNSNYNGLKLLKGFLFTNSPS